MKERWKELRNKIVKIINCKRIERKIHDNGSTVTYAIDR
jgi:hypothetical protein